MKENASYRSRLLASYLQPYQGCDFTVPTSTQGTVPCHSCKAMQPSYSSEFLDAVSATEIGGTVWPRVRDGCYRDSRSTS